MTIHRAWHTVRGTAWWRGQLTDPVVNWLRREAYALPIDLFRVAVGLLCFAYFARLIIEIPDFSHPNGLLDHALYQEIYWFTRWSLFQAGMPVAVFYLAFAGALVAAGGLVAGYRVKLCTAYLFVIAASTYRWNFLVMYLDDTIVHLTLFWLLLLPTGRTVTARELLRNPRAAIRRWSAVRVPGAVVWCFFLNICLIFFLAGAWKLNSVMWREGFGLYASLKVPIAFRAEFWGPEHLPVLRVVNYLVLLLEPVLIFPLLLPAGHWLKRLGGLTFGGFLVFILLTISVGYAILCLCGSLILFFGEEVNQRIRRWAGGTAAPSLQRRPRVHRLGWAAVAFLSTLTLATLRGVPGFGALNEPAYVALWVVGVAQDYHIFDWVDKVSYDVETEIRIERDHVVDVQPFRTVYPYSFRGKILLGYAHNIRWLIFPLGARGRIRESIMSRAANRFCRSSDGGGHVRVVSSLARIRPNDLDLQQRRPLVLASFQCPSVT